MHDAIKIRFFIFGKMIPPVFWGEGPVARCKLMHVPFLSILVFRKSLFPISGDGVGPGFGVKKGLKHVPKTGILIFRKQLWPFSGGATTGFAQKWQKWVQN